MELPAVLTLAFPLPLESDAAMMATWLALSMRLLRLREGPTPPYRVRLTRTWPGGWTVLLPTTMLARHPSSGVYVVHVP